jgi:hypothetical protein
VSTGRAPMRRRELPPRRTVVLLVAILFLAAFVVSRGCQKHEVAIDKERGMAIARTQVTYKPSHIAVRFVRRGIPSRGYWAVSLPGKDPPRITTVIVNAASGNIVEVNRERP